MLSCVKVFLLLAVIRTGDGYENGNIHWINVGQFIGPQSQQCPYHHSNWPQCNPYSRYRTIDGSCNNLLNPLWGKASTPFERFIAPNYVDGVSKPRFLSISGKPLPNARLISREFNVPFSNHWMGFNQFLVAFAQFTSHDINMVSSPQGNVPGTQGPDCCHDPISPGYPECFAIAIPQFDPMFSPNRTCLNFVRATPSENDLKCKIGQREQINSNTHFLDGSQIYGSSPEKTETLRTFFGGFLETNGDLLPPVTEPTARCLQTHSHKSCFRAGDDRVNQQPALASLHTLWMREHNRIAKLLAKVNPIWKADDELLFQEARRIVVAMLQHISYNEMLPAILGQGVMERYGLMPQFKGYFTGYNPDVKPMIRNVFSAAAFRFGHSMVSGVVASHNGFEFTSKLKLQDVYLKPNFLYYKSVTDIIRAETRLPSENVDRFVTPELSRYLFELKPEEGMDLVSIDIQRGRDHGIADYQTWRRFCGLHGYHSHDPMTFKVLENLYIYPEDIDLFPAALSELHVPGGAVGPTFACLIAEQFKVLKQGDRFFYENAGPSSFTQDQLHQIRKVTMSNVICRNTDIEAIQPHAFGEISQNNPILPCTAIADIDLSAWIVFSKCQLGPNIKAPCLPAL